MHRPGVMAWENWFSDHASYMLRGQQRAPVDGRQPFPQWKRRSQDCDSVLLYRPQTTSWLSSIPLVRNSYTFLDLKGTWSLTHRNVLVLTNKCRTYSVTKKLWCIWHKVWSALKNWVPTWGPPNSTGGPRGFEHSVPLWLMSAHCLDFKEKKLKL